MLLAIHTATAACSVALLGGAAPIGGAPAGYTPTDRPPLGEAHEIVGRGHAERLLPMIAALPGGGRADAILVDVGPGSFTGVRVGLAAARALGLGWGVPVHGYSSLAAIGWAALAATGGASVMAALPGGHGELFVQPFAAAPFRAMGPLANLPPAAAAALAADADALAGPGARALADAGAAGVLLAVADIRAQTAACLPAAFRTLPPVPIYGRAPDARLPA